MRPSSRFRRRGFTLVEVVVATLLLALAALGVASTTTAVSRLAASGRARALAQRALAAVVDSLRATPCPQLMSGTAASPVGALRWVVAPGAQVVSLVGTLTPASPRVRTPLREEVLVPCE